MPGSSHVTLQGRNRQIQAPSSTCIIHTNMYTSHYTYHTYTSHTHMHTTLYTTHITLHKHITHTLHTHHHKPYPHATYVHAHTRAHPHHTCSTHSTIHTTHTFHTHMYIPLHAHTYTPKLTHMHREITKSRPDITRKKQDASICLVMKVKNVYPKHFQPSHTSDTGNEPLLHTE